MLFNEYQTPTAGKVRSHKFRGLLKAYITYWNHGSLIRNIKSSNEY